MLQVLSTVKKWAAELKWGRESLEADPRSGHSSTATLQENIDRIHQMVMNKGRLTISDLTNVISISREQVENILHNELGMSKISPRWVPWVLTPDQKLTKLVMREANLARLRQTQIVLLSVFSPKMNAGSITLNQRPKGNPCSRSTQLLLLQKNKMQNSFDITKSL